MSNATLTSDRYDAIIVGSGAGGGVVAKVLSTAGKRVLLVERGDSLKWAEVSRDHLRNHRLSLYGCNTGPSSEGNPRVAVLSSGREKIIPSPHLDGYHHNAAAVGGGTLVYGAQAWRFMPQISGWPAFTACQKAAAWPTGRSATRIWSPTTIARNGSWVFVAKRSR